MTDPITTPEQMREAAAQLADLLSGSLMDQHNEAKEYGIFGHGYLRSASDDVLRLAAAIRAIPIAPQPVAKYGNRNVPKMIREIEKLRQAIRAEGTPAVQEAWDAVEEHIDFAYRTEAPQPVAVTVKPLVWEDGRTRLQMDPTMMMGKGYDFDTMELTRQEGYGFGCGYIIWAINSGLGKRSWNVYGTHDGIFIQDIASEDAAKNAAQADYEANIRSSIDATPARDVRAAALREAAAVVTAGDYIQNIQRRILALIDKEPQP